jgi:SPP1 gp7 family putative phage head morphogenesis protein
MMDKKKRQQQEKANKHVFDAAVFSMRPVYKKQKKALDEFEAVIGMLYIHYAVKGLIKPNKAQRRAILAEVGSKLNQIYSSLGSNEVDTVTDILRTGAEDMYKQYSSLLNAPKLAQASEKTINSIINTPIDETLFSDRIWANKEDLIKRLRQAINDIMQGNTTIDQAGKEIEKIFNVQAYQSKRLVETEITRIQAQAMKNIAKILGTKVMWSATFENTCEECAELDSEIFDIDKVPAIPVHPNCRCLLLPVVGRGGEGR